jgi:hypothetical protein
MSQLRANWTGVAFGVSIGPVMMALTFKFLCRSPR